MNHHSVIVFFLCVFIGNLDLPNGAQDLQPEYSEFGIIGHGPRMVALFAFSLEPKAWARERRLLINVFKVSN